MLISFQISVLIDECCSFSNEFILLLDETIPVDFNSNQTCLFCFNRKEYLDNQKSIHRTVEYPQSMIDDDENAPLDLSLKSTTQTTTTTNNSRTNIKYSYVRDTKQKRKFSSLDNDQCLILSQIFLRIMVKKSSID